MTIEWRRVTGYSQAVAIVLFVAVFAVGFCLGTKSRGAENVSSVLYENTR